ncbi:MAG TPA: RNA polymerase sigma factor [Solirubrobacterales bacterium]|nr:RNA polymerase sigma factor [Solirubrobacterales bacterium]
MTPAAALPPFQRLVTEHAGAVTGFLRGMVGVDDAEDCAQETFIAALRAYDGFDGRHPRAWLLAIARRKALDLRRAGARRPEPVGGVESLPAPELADRLDPGIWGEVAGLPEKQRAALLLRYGLDLRYREIGSVLGCSEAAARRSAHEGITKLRAERAEEVA